MGQDLASIPNATGKGKKVGREEERRKDKRPEKKIVSSEIRVRGRSPAILIVRVLISPANSGNSGS